MRLKAFVLSFTEALHHELKGSGIRVSCLCPGPTESEFSEVAGLAEARRWSGSRAGRAVVRAGLAGLDKGKAVVIPGLPNKSPPRSTASCPARRCAGSSATIKV